MLNSESDFQVSNKNRNLLTVWCSMSSLADATVLIDSKNPANCKSDHLEVALICLIN